jgi:secretion/DNA translocation related TadE-like protein
VRARRDGRGAATLLVLTMAGLLLFIGAALAVVIAIVVAHRTAQAAADLAALAGAQAAAEGGDACGAARGVARANHADLQRCEVSSLVVEVDVEVVGPHWLGQSADLGASSRAGPGP